MHPSCRNPAGWSRAPGVMALLAVWLVSSAPASAQAVPSPAAEKRLPTLFVCGDSTAAPMRDPIQGWGEQLGNFFDPARLLVENRALGGRSARTFLSEGRWEAVRRGLQKGDVVLLQFGHNDSKSAISANRYDLPGLGDEVEESTDPRTGEKIQIRTFGFYLGKMIDEGVAAGARVIVLSSVPRNKWADGKIVRGEENHGPWAAAVARSRGVPFVDVNARIADVYDPVGPARLKALFFPQDNTHTNPAGARVNAACVVQGLAQLNDPVLLGCLKASAVATAVEITAAVPRAAAEVKLGLNLKTLFPAAGATEVCPDTPLRLTFAAPPTLGTGGKIQIFDAADHSLVESIDVSAPVATKNLGGLPDYKYYPVIISGNEAGIYPKNNLLSYHKTYYVTIDPGVFKDGAEAYGGIDQPAAWSFSTRAAAPAAGTTRLTIAADGHGDFCTVQGALDFIPDGNTTPTTLSLRKGIYTEMVFFTNKHAITLQGEDRKQCIICYATNEKFNPAGGNPYATAGANPSAADRRGHIYHRGVFLAHRVNDLVIANLTIRNTTPQGGSQAEAIILNGTTTARAIIKDVDFYSFQDTIQLNGQAYVNNCYIEGDVDFMWGTGPCFFENCTAHMLRPNAYYTQIRNPGTNHGYVYYHCTLDGVAGLSGDFLSRIAPARFPNSEVVLLDCVLDQSVGAVGWRFDKNAPTDPTPIDPANVHFWEYHSHTADGSPVDVTQRFPSSRQLKQPDDAAIIKNYSDPAFVLGDGWNPKAALIFQ
jgi:pectin methylesterase-like acyl-CoA thioesterase/lysophospholipase L1-like esterase